ncbi:MAG: UPF0182 family protein, partial [Mycobacterium sp.]|nr:UPF0182 family protein [Mycobacterium sp.]
QYHITEPVAAYNGKGRWGVPIDPFLGIGNQPPYYILADPPGSSSNRPEFQLTTPMTVSNANNLAAYISANCDPGPGYGTLTVLKVPPNTNIAGPVQVANAFRSDPVVSHDISLFNGPGGQSTIAHGNLLTLPVGNSFLYVEPLYVQSNYPLLARVITYYGQQIGYESNLTDSLNDIRLPNQSTGQLVNSQNGGQSTTSPPPTTPPPTPTTPPPTPTTPPPTTTTPPANGSTSVPGTQVRLLQQIDSYFKESQHAYKQGNFAAGARAQAKAQQLIETYLARYGSLPARGSPAPKSPPSPSGG